ncbi:MAG TPA: DUF3352 domain-containing protein [Solirubrobacterales bacterium]|nr:DUF3352 domain-containing protein [Solirubrobacterales bacterium]
MRERLRRVRYMVADVLYVAGRGVASFGRRIGGLGGEIGPAWRRLPLGLRQGVAAAVALGVLLIAFVALAVPALPCGFPGGDTCPPADEAAEVVPAEALAYAHVNVDPGTEQFEQLSGTAEAVPGFREQIVARALALIPGPGGEPPDYAADVEPWFGGEAAVAVIPGPSTSTERVVLLEADDAGGARGYAESLAAGLPQPEDYRGVELTTDQRDVATAQVEGFLAVGSRSGVRAVIDTATGAPDATALADDDLASEVRDQLPDHRFAEAWISRDGATDLFTAGGTLGSLAPFLSPESTDGAAIAISAGEDELRLAVRSALNPEREETSPGFFAAFPSFEPTLTEEFADDSLAYVGIGDPGGTVRELLGQAAAEAPGIASGFDDLVDALRRDDGIDIEKELLPALGDEGAFVVEPNDPIPYLEFVSDGVDEEAARRALAALQKPVAEAVDPGTGLQAPVFTEEQVGGTTAHSLRVSPVVDLTYAVFEGLAAIASDPAGISQLTEGDGGLAESAGFERATEGFEDEVSLLAYLDLRRLIEEGIERGLAQVPAFNTFAEDFRSLDALGLAVRRADDTLATDTRLVFGK